MKKLVFSLGFVGFVVSCGAPAEDTTTGNDKDTSSTTPVTVAEEEPEVVNSFILEPGVVGIFKIGQPMPALPEELNSRKSIVTITDENGVVADHTQHVIFNSLEDVAEITMEHNPNMHEEDLVITDMKVISNYYETKDGIKKGTALTELVEKYPDTKIWYNGATGEILAQAKAYEGMYFVIDPAACNKACKGNKNIDLTAKSFNPDAKITSIKVF